MDHVSSVPQLGFGDFYGKQIEHRSVAGFCLSERQPEAWGDELPVHGHSEAHFIFLLNGEYVSTAVGSPAHCREPILIYNPPGVVHRDRFATGKGHFLGISIARDRMTSLRGKLALPIDAIALKQPVILSVAQALRVEQRHSDSASDLVIEGLCLELIGRIARARRGKRYAEAPRWLKSAQELLREQASRTSIEASGIAAEIGVPVHELVRGFRNHLGCSPGDYLRSKRMEKARDLLLHSDTPLAELALAVGYADQSSFTKAFTRLSGCSPGAYRKRVR